MSDELDWLYDEARARKAKRGYSERKRKDIVKRNVCIRMSPDIYARLQAACRHEGLRVSVVFEELADDWASRHGFPPGSLPEPKRID